MLLQLLPKIVKLKQHLIHGGVADISTAIQILRDAGWCISHSYVSNAASLLVQVNQLLASDRWLLG